MTTETGGAAFLDLDTLQLAARLICRGCDEGLHIERVKPDEGNAWTSYFMHLECGPIEDGDWIDCDAGPIVERMLTERAKRAGGGA